MYCICSTSGSHDGICAPVAARHALRRNCHGLIICDCMKNIVVLISGGGSNMAAIVAIARRDQWETRYGARIALVISNRGDAGGLLKAGSQGIRTEVVEHRAFSDRAGFEAQLRRAIDSSDPVGKPALVVMAGFMRILTPEFVCRYEGRLLNIHPSLLPAFPGLHTHRRALAAGCRFSGATVHWVTDALDGGPILAQAVVPILADDSEHDLAQRVLTQEHLLYPQAIARVLEQSAGG